MQSVSLSVLQQAKLKNYTQRFFKQKEKITLKFSLNQFAQLKFTEEDEFVLNNNQYDIITKNIVNENIIITCNVDKEDTTIYNELEKQHKKKWDLKQAKIVLYHSYFTWYCSKAPLVVKPSYKIYYPNNYKNSIINLLGPPPKYS